MILIIKETINYLLNKYNLKHNKIRIRSQVFKGWVFVKKEKGIREFLDFISSLLEVKVLDSSYLMENFFLLDETYTSYLENFNLESFLLSNKDVFERKTLYKLRSFDEDINNRYLLLISFFENAEEHKMKFVYYTSVGKKINFYDVITDLRRLGLIIEDVYEYKRKILVKITEKGKEAYFTLLKKYMECKTKRNI